jgi:hypothetical protein
MLLFSPPLKSERKKSRNKIYLGTPTQHSKIITIYLHNNPILKKNSPPAGKPPVPAQTGVRGALSCKVRHFGFGMIDLYSFEKNIKLHFWSFSHRAPKSSSPKLAQWSGLR